MSKNPSEPSSFSNTGRVFEQESEIELSSVGVDIGSSTSHIIFSRILMEKIGNRYIVKERNVLHESEIILTPYTDETTIDADALSAFIDKQYKLAELTPADIDTGALILTGVAVRRTNARAIAELFASHAGKFVAVSAGDALETILVAHGSGAVELSAKKHLRVMNVDIGGGTTKIAVCDEGEVVDFTAIDVGARIISFDESGCLTRIEEAGKYFASEAGITLKIGDQPDKDFLEKIAKIMADKLFQAMDASLFDDEISTLLRLDPLQDKRLPDIVTFSGGVSEYISNREKNNYGDLGPMLALAVNEKIKAWGPDVYPSTQGIRATVVGASQYTTQVSGNTIFVEPQETLPVRNIPVLTPNLPLEKDVINIQAIAERMRASLEHLNSHDNNQPVAVYFRWRGSATYSRIDAFCKGIIQGLAPILSTGAPLILVSEGDIGGLFGLHCLEECNLQNPIVSIDGILLKAFDFIDIGSLLDSSGVVPVVIKSLVFPATSSLGRITNQ